jgi:hypothetical protein
MAWKVTENASSQTFNDREFHGHEAQRAIHDQTWNVA